MLRKSHRSFLSQPFFARLYLLLLSLPSNMALLNVPVAEKVSEVAKDGEDAIAHVGQHGHQEWSLLVVLQKRLLVQATVAWRNILVLEGSKVQSICHVTTGTLHMWQDSVQASACQTSYGFMLLIKQSCF